MNKFKFYFILSIATVSLFSCSKDETVSYEPPREYSVQYDTDIKVIEDYLNTHYLNMDLTDPNFADKDVVMTQIPVGGTQPSLMSYLNATTYPKLLSKTVSLHDISYKLYYLVLREGVGIAPCNVDGVLASYKGDYLESVAATTTTAASINAVKFEEMKFPQSFFDLPNTIQGWGETFPEFKTGTYTSNPDGTITYKDFGAGAMFIPSGLGYYNTGSGSIPSYSPLIFSFKLYEIRRLDQDADGIPSYLEDLDGDGYVRYLGTGIENIDDTDKDGVPNFLDVDDDGDKYSTKLEITNAATGLVYPFASIPDCSGNSTDPARIKKHLDKTCH
ncbi:FKBP-type peptidylprolyl isomerase [Flavobacterium sp.]|uniref:FKBP-type peptidyl-prolyl cis-trans isomerase n=1 Tax=Flavobacterium sp. TaxID=239 RepID=UPI0025C59C3A|nr:FKBP-type peptidylprolyl isomerase [Flavobacterium sp.]MBA4276469.1 FKBP-type peptidylprolyl isomerase [Flavobacterium sp.]